MGTRETIRQLVAALIAEQGGSALPADDTPLLRSGALDSLSVMKIAVFMEREFGVDFSELYFDQGAFNSVDAMVAFAEEHRSDRQAPGG